jgi:hypothetical protein
MRWLDRLFGGGSEDVTRDWLQPFGPCPRISLERGALESFGGKIAFGDPVEQARFLGRPPDRTFSTNLTRLSYPAWGLEIEFERGRFILASFDVARSAAGRFDPSSTTAQVTGPDGRALTPHTSKAEILQRFGEPTTLQEFDDETVMYYHHGPLVCEFQLNEAKLLATWDVYLDE